MEKVLEKLDRYASLTAEIASIAKQLQEAKKRYNDLKAGAKERTDTFTKEADAIKNELKQIDLIEAVTMFANDPVRQKALIKIIID